MGDILEKTGKPVVCKMNCKEDCSCKCKVCKCDICKEVLVRECTCTNREGCLGRNK